MSARSARRKVIITNPAGLHARPSAAIVKAVGRFKSKVEIRKNGEAIDAGSIVDLMGLGASQGTELLVTAKGPDAEEAIDAVVAEFAKHYG
jgi:phosphotransferase system HPr (HPr) family protein